MLSREEFIRLSLELNLFFGRIAKEHSIFIETSFTGKDQNLAREADNLKVQFEDCCRKPFHWQTELSAGSGGITGICHATHARC
jgi:hypothetical protein